MTANRCMWLFKNAYGLMLSGLTIGIAFLTGLVVVMERMHHRKFLTLISPDSTIQWKRIAQGLGLWFVLRFFGLLICSIVMPSRYVFSFNPYEWFPYALLGLICLPIFTLVRHLTLYAYLLQGMGLWIRNPYYLAIVWGLCLSLTGGLIHPLIWLTNFVSAAMICWIILKKECRQELVIGFTFSDLLTRILFLKNLDTSPYNPTIYTFHGSSTTLLGPVIYLISLGLFYYYFFGRSQKPYISNSG